MSGERCSGAAVERWSGAAVERSRAVATVPLLRRRGAVLRSAGGAVGAGCVRAQRAQRVQRVQRVQQRVQQRAQRVQQRVGTEASKRAPQPPQKRVSPVKATGAMVASAREATSKMIEHGSK